MCPSHIFTMAEEEEAASPHRVVQNTGSEQTWTDGEQQKIAAILEACSCQDIDRLKELAVSKDGFLVDSLRRQACEYSNPAALPTTVTLIA